MDSFMVKRNSTTKCKYYLKNETTTTISSSPPPHQHSYLIQGVQNIHINGTCEFYQKRTCIWSFYLSQCTLILEKDKNIRFSKKCNKLRILVYMDETEKQRHTMYNDDVFLPDESFENIDTLIAIQSSARVRKQVHTIQFENALLKVDSTWIQIPFGQARVSLNHSTTHFGNLQDNLTQEETFSHLIKQVDYSRKKKRQHYRMRD